MTPSPLFADRDGNGGHARAVAFLAMRETFDADVSPSLLPPVVGAPAASHTIETSGSLARVVPLVRPDNRAWLHAKTLRATALDVDQWNAAGRPSRVHLTHGDDPPSMVATGVLREARRIDGAAFTTLAEAAEALDVTPVVLAVENDRAAAEMPADKGHILSAVFDVFVVAR